MENIMSHNVFEFKDNLVVCGSCLQNMDKPAFEKLKQISGNIYSVCLEETHMNMLLSKLAGILEAGKVRNIIIASVDKSPHCVQLHYVGKELIKTTNRKDVTVTSYVAKEGDLIKISPETISLSKNLAALNTIKRA
jgi:hypothetical protein